ncbi:alcohol oxidase [Mycena filopes]|nr:alcohol oxidase [Mycena filopes]
MTSSLQDVLAGGPFHFVIVVTPAMFGSHFTNPQYDWAFTTASFITEQENAANRNVYFARGKGLGGSSAINFFQYHRPAASDIDAFETLGNPGWNWKLLKKYYSKAESFVLPAEKHDTMEFDVREHGTDGPLVYGYPLTLSNFEGPYREALRKVGVSHAPEPTRGTWLTPVSIDPRKRVRSYSANMHYQPNAARPNLKVLVSAHVTKIELVNSSGLATADRVVFLCDGKSHEISVSGEVILCAGTIMSPQILELSGIGDPAVLKKAGVEVKVALPGVGENVQEHIFRIHSHFSPYSRLPPPPSEIRKDKAENYNTFDCLKDPAIAAQQFSDYKLHGTGVCGMAPICMTFVPLASVSPDAPRIIESLKEWIKVETDTGRISPARLKQLAIHLDHSEKQEPEIEMVLGQAFNSQPNPPQPDTKYISLHAMMNHPISRGSIHIKSKDPLQAPLIDPRYFESDYDLKAVVETFKFNRRLVKEEPLCNILSDTVGSCSMLPLAEGGVVDRKLKVYDTSNIRVVDLSIIPLHIGAHTQATAYALAELGSSNLICFELPSSRSNSRGYYSRSSSGLRNPFVHEASSVA